MKYDLKIYNENIPALFDMLEKQKEYSGINKNVKRNLENLKDKGWVKSFTRKLEDDIWELKVSKVRILYAVEDKSIKLLYGFIKSTPAIPKRILKNAIKINASSRIPIYLY